MRASRAMYYIQGKTRVSKRAMGNQTTVGCLKCYGQVVLAQSGIMSTRGQSRRQRPRSAESSMLHLRVWTKLSAKDQTSQLPAIAK